MKVLLVEPGKEPCPAEIGEGLKAMQKVVGGLIQAIYPFIRGTNLQRGRKAVESAP